MLLVIASGAALLTSSAAAAQTTPPRPVLWAVGDAQSPDVAVQNQVADLIGSEPPERLLFLGDLTNGGTAAEYATLYGPSYGRFKAITAPTIGNHDWAKRAEGYDAYWGPGVQQPGGGHWYSFDLGGWHVVSLSSMEDASTSSAQLAWLRQDLAARGGTCTLAFAHHPRYSAGPQFNTLRLEPLWGALRNRATLFLSGHAHNYQRLLPIRGITQFVVGTGGGALGNTDDWDPRLAAKTDRVRGALRVELAPASALLRFVDVNGTTVDESRVDCQPAQPIPASARTTRPLARTRYPRLKQLSGRVDNAERIRLTVLRRVGSRCQAFDGRHFRSRSCRTRLSFPLTDAIDADRFPRMGTTRWRWRVPGGASLPPGDYRLDVRVRAIDDSVAVRSTRFAVGRR